MVLFSSSGNNVLLSETTIDLHFLFINQNYSVYCLNSQGLKKQLSNKFESPHCHSLLLSSGLWLTCLINREARCS
jgi:hypothetical protein